jgi:hypothetical protein
MVKPAAKQPLNGSMGQLTPTVKSVGGVTTTLLQFSTLVTTQVSVGVGVGLGVDVGVGVGLGVGVAVAVGVGVIDGVAKGVGVGVDRSQLIVISSILHPLPEPLESLAIRQRRTIECPKKASRSSVVRMKPPESPVHAGRPARGLPQQVLISPL